MYSRSPYLRNPCALQSRPRKSAKDPAASPVARLFTLHTQRCQHTSSKLHRVFGHPVLHPRFPNDVDTEQLVSHHLRKACTCKGPPPTLQRKAATTLSGMSEAEVQAKVPQIVCPRCQHDLAYHRQRTPDEDYNAAVLAHFRPELVDQCTRLPEPVLPRECPPSHAATRIETSISIYKVQVEEAPQTPTETKELLAATGAPGAPLPTAALQDLSSGQRGDAHNESEEEVEETQKGGGQGGRKQEEGKTRALKYSATQGAPETTEAEGSAKEDDTGDNSEQSNRERQEAKQHRKKKEEEAEKKGKSKKNKKRKKPVFSGFWGSFTLPVRRKGNREAMETDDDSTDQECGRDDGSSDASDTGEGGAKRAQRRKGRARRRVQRRWRPSPEDESNQDDDDGNSGSDSGGSGADVEVVEEKQRERSAPRAKRTCGAANGSNRRGRGRPQQSRDRDVKRAKRTGVGAKPAADDDIDVDSSASRDDDRVSVPVGDKGHAQTTKPRPPSGSVLGFFSPAPKPKHTGPPPPLHPFKGLLEVLQERSSASRVEQRDDVQQLRVCGDATAVCIRTDAPYVILLHRNKQYPLFEGPESDGADALAVDVCAVDNGYGIAVITGRHNSTQTVHLFLASTSTDPNGGASELNVEKRGCAVLSKGQAVPSALYLTHDALAVGTWENGLWLFSDPLQLELESKTRQQSLKAQHVLNRDVQVYAATLLDGSAVLCACSDLRLHCISTAGAVTGERGMSSSSTTTTSSHVHSAAITTVSVDAKRGLALSSGLDGLLCIWHLKRNGSAADVGAASRHGGAVPVPAPGWRIEPTPVICLELTGRLPILHHRHCDEYVLFIQREDASHRASVIRLPPAALHGHAHPSSGVASAATGASAAIVDASQDSLTLRHIAGDRETIEFEDAMDDVDDPTASADTQETIVIKGSNDDNDSRGDVEAEGGACGTADEEASRSRQNTPPLPNKPRAIVPS